jgi:diguanylate cyclase (GGDEF)-like protein
MIALRWSRTEGSAFPMLGANFAVAAAYFATSAVLDEFFSALGLFPAPFWPAAGVALFAAFLGGWAVWPAIFLGSFAANAILFGSPPETAAAISLTNMLGPGIGAELLRRGLGRWESWGLREVRRFLAYGVVLHAAITGFGGATVIAGFADMEAWAGLFARWFVSDVAGALLIAPPAILWWQERQPLDRTRLGEMAVIVLLLVSIAASQFFVPAGNDAFLGLPYLVLLPCTWLALRFTPRDASTLFAAVILIAVAGLAAVADSLELSGVLRVPIPGLAIVGGMLNVILVGALTVERDAALRLAALDELTGLPNRRAFEGRAEQERARARRYGQAVALVEIDIDRFKVVNDTYGHAAGDRTLSALAKLVLRQLRAQDVVARLGGEEFVALLPETDIDRALAVCERLRAAVAAMKIEDNGATFAVTVSMGVTVLTAADESILAALARADRALYRAKAQGRNRVVAAAN